MSLQDKLCHCSNVYNSSIITMCIHYVTILDLIIHHQEHEIPSNLVIPPDVHILKYPFGIQRINTRLMYVLAHINKQ